jgi:hypothetical protein
MSTISRYNRRNFLKAAAPAAIARTRLSAQLGTEIGANTTWFNADFR